MLKESCLLMFLFAAAASGMICWKCGNAKNMLDCRRKGRLDTCTSDQGMCITEVRKSAGRMTINKECKQTTACKNMRKQNYMKDGSATQCNRSPNSVCCCCCGNDGCNNNMGMCRSAIKTRRPTKKPRQSSPKRPRRPRTRKPYKKPKMPKRARSPMCPMMSKQFLHGSMRCWRPSKRRGMICDFRCTEEGYTLFPRHDMTLSCMPNGKWSHPKPCCGMACGPPKYDVMALAHASSEETYETMYKLFETMFKRLAKNPTDIRRSHIEFGSQLTYTLDYKEFLEDVNKKHNFEDHSHNNTADGLANIGVALSAAYDMFSSEKNSDNRKEVKDVILLATDADSDDDMLAAANMWKKEQAIIIVVTFPKDGVYPNKRALLALTDEDHHIIKYKKGRAPDIAYFIADDLADHSCVNPCKKSNDQ